MEPVRETVTMAKACEAAGFDTFWLAEAYPWWRKHSIRGTVLHRNYRGRRLANQPDSVGLGNHFAVHPASGADRDGGAGHAGRWPAKTVSYSAWARRRSS